MGAPASKGVRIAAAVLALFILFVAVVGGGLALFVSPLLGVIVVIFAGLMAFISIAGIIVWSMKKK